MLIRTPTSANVATTTPIATLTTTRRMENLRAKPITHAAADATARQSYATQTHRSVATNHANVRSVAAGGRSEV
ncbi:hypothetical protein LBMAG48_25520 [Phycisphaerae bacterium]|nr:hypothetical protein LBMAG48_25520 [Phycisphaerae bacterium]